MPTFTLVFVIALLANVAVQAYLNYRQSRHIAQHRHAVPGDFVPFISLAQHQKAADYQMAKGRFALLTLATQTALVLGFTLLGGLGALSDTLSPLFTQSLHFQVALVLIFLGLQSLINLPLQIYHTFGLETRFGFNRSSGRQFAIDTAKSLLLTFVIATPLLYALFAIMASTQYWWLWGWAIFAAFSIFMLWVSPRYLLPLFNRFTPLNHPALQSRIERLCRQTGFALQGLFVMDGSTRSTHGNAFFTGMGRHKRIVFFDTLLDKLSPEQIEAVLAHELGHFKHGHVQRRLLSSLLLSFGFFALLGLVAQQGQFLGSLGVFPGVEHPPHAVTLLLLLLVVPIFSYFFTPLFTYASRRDEFQADQFATQHADAQALIDALLRLYEDNAATLTPDPWHSAFYDSHPPATQRIARLRQLGALETA